MLITDHNVEETLCITDRAYLLFEGQILFHGTPEELAVNPVVLDKYLTRSFKLRLKDFQKMDRERSGGSNDNANDNVNENKKQNENQTEK